MKRTNRWLAILVAGLFTIPQSIVIRAEELTDIVSDEEIIEFDEDILNDGVEEVSEQLIIDSEVRDVVDQLEDNLLFDGDEEESLESEVPEESLVKVNASSLAGYIKSAKMVYRDQTVFNATYDYDIKNRIIIVDMKNANRGYDFVLPINKSPFMYDNPMGIIAGLESELGFSSCPIIMDGTITQIIVNYANRIEVYRFNSSGGRVNDYTRTVYKMTESGEPGEVVIVIPVSYEYDGKGRLVKVKSSYDSKACTNDNWEYLPDCTTSYSFEYSKDNKLTSFHKSNDGPYEGDMGSNGKFEISYHNDGTMEIVHDMYYMVISNVYTFANNRVIERRSKTNENYDPVVPTTFHYDEYGNLCGVKALSWYYELTYYGNTGGNVSQPTPTPQPSVNVQKTQITAIYNSVKGADIRWEKAAGAKSYEVYRKRSGEGTKKVATITNANTTQCYDSGIKNNCWGRVYNYYVVPIAGSAKGAKSDDVVLQRLAPMTLTSVKNTAAGKAAVTWKCSVNSNKANGYELQYAQSQADLSGRKGTYKAVTINGRDNLNRTLNGLTKGKTYYFRIRCYVNYTNSVTKKTTKPWSQYSNVVSVKITK